jgi:hypothetical protein
MVYYFKKNLFSLILGKTVLIKKKAINTKHDFMAQGNIQSVYFIPLTSCDERGKPVDPIALFDLFSKNQMFKHNVIVMTVQDLYKEYKKSNVMWDDLPDFISTSVNPLKDQKLKKVFEDASNKAIGSKMGPNEFMQIMSKNGINIANAAAEVDNRMQNPTNEEYKIDVYNLLYWFVKQKSRTKQPFHLFVDEFPLLQSSSSKLLLFFILKCI